MSAFNSRAEDGPRRIELLRDLTPDAIQSILSVARQRKVRAGSMITYQGDVADYLLLLWKGRARYFYEVPDGKKLILKWIVPGDILGGATILSRPSTYLLSTEAVRDSVVFEWSRQAIRTFARKYPQMLENANQIAMEYLSWHVRAHAARTSSTAKERLASVISAYGRNFGEKVAGGVEFYVTNEELACSANITPYTASRLISAWQKAGVIRKSRGRIVLRSPKSIG